jgi:hypothetical protein
VLKEAAAKFGPLASWRSSRDAEGRDGKVMKHLLLVIFLVWIAIYLKRRKRR